MVYTELTAPGEDVPKSVCTNFENFVLDIFDGQPYLIYILH